MAAVPLTGALKGTPPTIFTGNRAESEQFLREFRQWRRTNRNHELVLSPYQRVGLALGLIRGPAVNDWGDAAERTLDAATTRTVNPLAETDEALWTTFETDFKAAWTDTLSKQNAYQQLTALVMSGDDIDGYIATFERLAHVADWHREASGTVDVFRHHLTSPILRACLLRTTPPETMTEWQTAARAEVQRARTLASCFPSHGKRATRTPDIGQYAPVLVVPPPVAPTSDGVVPMDIDAAYVPRIRTPQELAQQQKCRDEGRCFKCFRTGHVSKFCPKRSAPAQANTVSMPPAPMPQTQPGAAPVEINETTVRANLLHLSRLQRQNVIADLLLMEGDDLSDDGSIVQINAACLSTPARAASRRTTFLRPAAEDDSSSGSDWHPQYLSRETDLFDLTDTDGDAHVGHTPRSIVADDNTPNGGVKSSISPVSSPASPVFSFLTPVDEPPRPDLRRKTLETVNAAEEFDFETFYASYCDDNHLPQHTIVSAAVPVLPSADHEPARPRPQHHHQIFPSRALERPRDPDQLAPAAQYIPGPQNHVTPAPAPSPVASSPQDDFRIRLDADIAAQGPALTASIDHARRVIARRRDRAQYLTGLGHRAHTTNDFRHWCAALAAIRYRNPDRPPDPPVHDRPPDVGQNYAHDDDYAEPDY
ncbi:hypothetical protein EDB85DRAFT_1965419 [Lactarius pseudohatsudake]|nr:hypothetical protein EDB85DRAFT_1965419 [Lactarius pseudohatsudake]